MVRPLCDLDIRTNHEQRIVKGRTYLADSAAGAVNILLASGNACSLEPAVRFGARPEDGVVCELFTRNDLNTVQKTRCLLNVARTIGSAGLKVCVEHADPAKAALQLLSG